MSAKKENRPELAEALKEAHKAPETEGLWNRLEELAASAQRPDEVAQLYRTVLKDGGPELAGLLGQRAVRFHEEWFGAQADELVEILTRILESDPTTGWALRRLSVLYTVKERWADLLALYDRSLAAIEDVGHRREVLEEAAHVAKDFVGDTDRAIGYLTERHRLSPNDTHLATQLERLLERQGRYRDLANLWASRLPNVSPGEARALRIRSASLVLEKLGDPAGALTELERVLAAGEDDEAACELVEKILRLPSAPGEVRRRALSALRIRYEASGRSAKVIPASLVGLEFVEPAERVALHREIAERLASTGDRAGAMDQLIVLSGLEPADDGVAERLRHLAELEGDPRPYVRGLDAAADATENVTRRLELWLEAARIHEEALQDARGALTYFRRAHAETAADGPTRLLASRKLAELLAVAPDAEESPGERIAVLESLAQSLAASASKGSERKAVLGEVARLAEERKEVQRAAAAWVQLVELDSSDRSAIDGLVGLFERAREWESLVAALKRRIAVSPSPEAIRADLMRLARVQAAELGQLPAAIDTWSELQRTYGEDTETVSALGELYALAGRWGEMAALLTRAGETDSGRLAGLYCRLADVCREKLADPGRAAGFYGRALEVNPAHAGALHGARALLELESSRVAAAEALARAYQATGDWRALVGLCELRLLGASDDAARVRLLCEAAALHERKGEDPGAALALLARALPMAPEDGSIEKEMVRLATWTRDSTVVVEALRAAAQATQDPVRASRLRFQEGQFFEARGEAAPAQEAYQAAFVRDASRLELREALVRTAARAGDWGVAAQTALGPEVAREPLERSLLPLLEALAAECSGHAQLAEAAATALHGTERGGDPALARDLEAWVARQCEAAGGEGGAQRAEAALTRASLYARRVREAREVGSADGLAASELAILRRLSAAQRSRPSRALCDTLLALADLSPNDLDPLEEAATLALGPLGAEPLAGTILARLLDQATRLLRTDQAASGAVGAAKAAAWAAEELARIELSRPDRSAWARAVELLLDAARLPLPRPAIRNLRWRVAGLALDKLRDRRLAMQVLRQMADDDVQDAEAIARLGGLYEEERRLPELLGLRQEELSRTLEIERRLALRLEVDKIAAALEERSGRLEVLRANLEEQPGHWPTIETLARLLESRHRHEELVDLLTDQAARVEERGDRPAAGRLWDWIARLLVQPLGERDRAIRAYERVAELQPQPATFESLGRLWLEKGEPLRAAAWLERWQAAAEGPSRTQAALELAGAYLRGDKRPRAVACLERALVDDPQAFEVRKRLIDLHRASETWEPLVRVLGDGAVRAQDPDTILSYAREAAEIAQTRLGAPHAALAPLERAVALAPQDAGLRSQYAEALFAAGELGQARALLETLIHESGRRRSRERAGLHLRVARVARAESKPAEALEHLEQAAEMDMDSAATLETLAEVAEQAGEYDRAERAFRALMLLIRRGGKGAALSATEALLRLRQIALLRGQNDKAQDLLDSAIADAIGSPDEARRIGKALRDQGSLELLAMVLEKRLAATSDPGEQASILIEQAEIAAGQGQAPRALETALAALSEAPANPAILRAARRISREVGASDRYARALLALASEKRRADDAQLGATWLCEAGDVLRDEVKDDAAAAEAYSRAAQLGLDGGVAAVQAAHALVGVSEARRDAAERAKAIKVLARLGRPGTPSEVRVEALFRLAQAQLTANESVEQALAALSSALELSSDIERAFAIVREAKVADADLARVLPLYEHVARASKDEGMLLDFFERRAALATVTLDQVKEGIEFAASRDMSARAVVMLERAVALARAADNREGLEWATLELAEARRASGDIAGAVACLEEARELADPVRTIRIYQDIARAPLEGRVDPVVVGRVYERLWEREPTERRSWEPLLRVYIGLRDVAGVERVSRATVERLFDPTERNAVRMVRARFLASVDRKDPALVETLRDVLLDEPTLEEAIELLADVYQASGNEAGLTELLASEIEAALGRRDVPAVVALSLRLGSRHLAAGAMGEARDVYRKALLLAPDDTKVLRELASLLAPQEDARERAVVLERLLGNESGEEAGRIAVELSLLWEAMGDDERVQRALETGVARGGGSVDVFDRLCELYRSRHAWDRLAAALIEQSDRRAAPAERATLLRQAAEICRTNLSRSRDAAELLRRARRFAPEDAALLTDLVQSLDALGEGGLAAEELSQALAELPDSSNQRAVLLQTRANLYEKAGQYEKAVQDREAALGAGGEVLRPALRAAMERWRTHTAQRGDAAAERRAMRHLTDFLIRGGEEADARAVLADWCYRHPEDSESLRALVARDLAGGRWDAVVESAFRLIEADTGEGQISAAELLVEACERLDQPAPAIAGLESALRQQPSNTWLFEKLLALYEKTGDRRKQATLLSWSAEQSNDPEVKFRCLRQAGEILLREKDLEKASVILQQALALRPGDRELSWLLADVCIAGGRLGEAEEILQAHMKKAAKDLSSSELSSLQHRMAQLAQARGDQTGRFDWLRRAFETNRKDGAVAAELADLAEETNDIDLAVKALRAVTLAPAATGRLTPAMAYLRQARIAQRSGDRPKAVIFAKRALQEDPRLSDAAELLREMGERRV